MTYLTVKDLKEDMVPDTIPVEDFLERLTSHESMSDFVDVSPLNIVRIDANNLANLQTQIQGIDSSFIGNFLVQYQDAIVIYDYENDEIKGNVQFQQQDQQTQQQNQQQVQSETQVGQPAQQQNQLPEDFYTKLFAHTETAELSSEQPSGGQLNQETLAPLQEQFPDVYDNARVGDFLLRFSTKLVVYDYSSDIIVSVVNLS